MGRSKKIDQPFHLQVRLPESLVLAMDLELYNELEARVPFGARGELVAQLLRDWLQSRGVVI